MISGLDRAVLRAEAREFFGLDPDRPTLLVTGGSQGARKLNQSIAGRTAGISLESVLPRQRRAMLWPMGWPVR